VLEVAAAALQRLVVDLDGGHRQARAGEHLGDAGTHGAQPDDAELLADHPATLAEGLTLVRREYPTAIGPVDLMCRDGKGRSIAVEIKRRGDIDGVEQLTRYLELLNRDPKLRPVRGIFAAQEIRPQARVLATDRGIACAVVDYDSLRGMDDPSDRLF
jgi:RecB family endonuclease NucS